MAAAAGTAALLAVLWIDDPYVAFLVGLPLALGALAWFARPAGRGGRDRRLLGLAATLVASITAAWVLRGLLLPAVGIQVVADATGPTLDPAALLRHLGLLPVSAREQLGLTEPGTAASAGHVLAVALLVLATVAAGAVAVRGWRRGRLAVTFLGVHCLVVVAAVVGNRTIYDFHAGRYLVQGFVDLAACLALGLALLRERRREHAGGQWPATVAPALVGLAVAVNLISAAVDHPVAPARVAAEDAEHQAVLDTLLAEADRGATKGLGPFWAADLYTHMSGGRVLVSDVSCAGGRLRHRRWLTDTARVTVPATRSVVVVPPSAVELAGCTADGIAATLGGAERRVVTTGGTIILVFDRDVAGLVLPAAPDG